MTTSRNGDNNWLNCLMLEQYFDKLCELQFDTPASHHVAVPNSAPMTRRHGLRMINKDILLTCRFRLQTARTSSTLNDNK
ncbi:hypothetical protein DP033_08900 [Escherichia coli]|nr:hypothetical protein [Escherichia coli]